MKTFITTLLTAVLLWGQCFAQVTDKIQPIEPPFGLSWGESADNVLKWAKKNEFGTAQGKIHDGRNVIEIHGPFPDTEFDRLRFYFLENGLTEVELQFIQTGPIEDGIEFEGITKAMAIKNRVDGKMGKGQLIKNEAGVDGGSNWKFIQQIWTDEEHAIWLAVFNASAKKEMLSIVSLHYRWETKLKQPAVPPAFDPIPGLPIQKKLDAQPKTNQ